MGKRIVFEVRYSSAEKLWFIKRRDISGGVLAWKEKKSDAVARARQEARLHWVNNREPVELIVYRQDGAIGQGHSSRASYPRRLDPRRHKG